MNILGVEIFKSGTLGDIQKQFTEVQKVLKESQKLRPEAFEVYRTSPTDYNVQIPLYPIDERTLYDLALNSDIVRTVINAIRDGIFRRGFQIKELKDLPDEKQRVYLEKLIKKANNNNQTLKAVLKQFEQDLNVLDNAYLLITKDYFYDGYGEILESYTKPTEVLRVHPTKMRKVADSKGRMGYNEEGKKLFVSMTDRSKIFTEDEAIARQMLDDDGRKLQQALFRGELKGGEFIYYIEGEVFHDAKYNPSLLYGYSQLLSCWMKVYTLIAMDRYLMLAYQKGRPPKGILAISTSNYQSVENAWENLLNKTREDPHAIYPLAIENNKNTGSGTIEWINFMNNLQEMEYIESRNEMRRVIGALYKVMPMFSGDIAQSGGLNNEGKQIDVTGTALEEGQKTYNDKVLPFIVESFGVTDFEIVLEEPEEEDEIEEEKKLGIKIDNAVKMSNMGFAIDWNEEEMEFSYSESQENQGQFFQGSTTDVNDAMARIDKTNISDYKNKVEKIYTIEKKIVEGEIKKQFDVKKADSNTFLDFITKALWAKTFDGINKSKSDVIKGIILDAVVKKESMTDVIKKIQDAGVEKEQAEMIARTESAGLKNKSREFSFMQAEKAQEKEFKYKWLGPKDNRTTGICKNIKKRTAKGVSMSELKKIIKEEADKEGVQARPDDLVAHPGERHTFVKI